jgi:hypothetical protein
MFRQFVSNAFRGGVHRWIFVYIVVGLILILPFYFIGQFASKGWYQLPANPAHFVNKDLVNKNYTTKNDGTIKFDEVGVSELLGEQKLLYTFAINQGNKNFGYDPFVYKAQVLDENGKVLSESTESTYILPNDATFISAYSNDPKASNLKIIQLPDSKQVQYNPLANPLLKKIQLDVRDASVVELDQSNLSLRASIKNINNIQIGKVDVILIIRDSQDGIVGAKNFSFNNLGPNDERDIELEYPKPKDKNAVSLDVRYSVNYLDENNIQVR